MAFFEGNNMTGGYGNGPDIINSCSVNVERGEIVSILGPNGAGKSTAMKAMLDTIDACVQGDYTKSKLTTFDIEYMFTQIRGKSVGESIDCLLYTSPSPRDNR